MISSLLPTLLAILANFIAIIFAQVKLRPVIALLWLTSFYYSLAGPLYWLIMKDGDFLGVNWTDEIPRASSYISISTLCLVVTIMALDSILHGSNKRPRQHLNSETSLDSGESIAWGTSIRVWQAFFALGLFSTIIVCGQILRGAADAESVESLNLVAYQFSDLLIPCLVFIIGARGFDKLTLSMLLLFTAYAAIVGFRYKLVLVYFPIIIIYLFPVLGPKNISVFKGLLIIFGVAVGFSLLTITRSKFSGIDVHALSTASSEDILYGFFAESNTIFGMIGVLRESVDANIYIHLDPIRDALLELIPRAILPDRVTGTYLGTALERLIAAEAMNSATAYPYLGELLLMGGHPALVLGTLIIASVYLFVARVLERLPSGAYRLANAGYGLLAVYFGYYYFSRGYFPQTFKAFLFVVIPFVMTATFVGRNRPNVGSGTGYERRVGTERLLNDKTHERRPDISEH